MATQKILRRSERLFLPLFRNYNIANDKQQMLMYSQKTSMQKEDKMDVDFDKPVQFSSSEAAQFSSSQSSQEGVRTNRAKYEHIIVRVSLAVFMIYFCVLREENDLDQSIGESIFSKVPDLEIVMLRNKRKKCRNARSRHIYRS